MNNFDIGKSGKNIKRYKKYVIKEIDNKDISFIILKHLNSLKFKYVPKIIEINSNYIFYKYIRGKTIRKVDSLSIFQIKHLSKILFQYYKLVDLILPKVFINKGYYFCHNDINPLNMVFKFNKIKCIIDWNGMTFKERYIDLYYAVWTCSNFGSLTISDKRKLKLIKTFILNYDDVNIFNDFYKKMMNIILEYKNNYLSDKKIVEWCDYSLEWLNKNESEVNQIVKQKNTNNK